MSKGRLEGRVFIPACGAASRFGDGAVRICSVVQLWFVGEREPI